MVDSKGWGLCLGEPSDCCCCCWASSFGACASDGVAVLVVCSSAGGGCLPGSSCLGVGALGGRWRQHNLWRLLAAVFSRRGRGGCEIDSGVEALGLCRECGLGGWSGQGRYGRNGRGLRVPVCPPIKLSVIRPGVSWDDYRGNWGYMRRSGSQLRAPSLVLDRRRGGLRGGVERLERRVQVVWWAGVMARWVSRTIVRVCFWVLVRRVPGMLVWAWVLVRVRARVVAWMRTWMMAWMRTWVVVWIRARVLAWMGTWVMVGGVSQGRRRTVACDGRSWMRRRRRVRGQLALLDRKPLKPGLSGLLNWAKPRFKRHTRAVGYPGERAVSQGRRIRAVLNSC